MEIKGKARKLSRRIGMNKSERVQRGGGAGFFPPSRRRSIIRSVVIIRRKKNKSKGKKKGKKDTLSRGNARERVKKQTHPLHKGFGGGKKINRSGKM